MTVASVEAATLESTCIQYSDRFRKDKVEIQALNDSSCDVLTPSALIEERFNRLGRAKQFTRLDLTNAYHR